jgi:glycosyltransferase involved in cell wall biosynthesis
MLEKLFSVVVLTYNQETLVEETLNSIYNQSFENIELVISDDASKDNTQKVITDWIENHKNRFANVVTNFNKKNLGISGNSTTGIKLANGEFVKSIGGDDILLPDAIEKMHDFLKNNKEARFCTSKMKMFYKKNADYITFGELPEKRVFKKLKEADVNKQFRILSVVAPNIAPGTFFRTSIFEDYGYYDERYTRLEDWPQWLKFLLHGERLFLLDEYTVLYRKHENAVSINPLHSGNNEWLFDHLNLHKEYIFPNLDKLSLMEALHVLIREKKLQYFLEKGFSKKNLRITKLYNLIDPLWWSKSPTWVFRKAKSIRMNKINKEIFSQKNLK